MVSNEVVGDEAVATVALGGTRADITVAADRIALRLRLNDELLSVDITLGPTVAGVDLGRGSRLVREQRDDVSGSWTARSGKATGLHEYRHAGAVLHLIHQDGIEWQLRVRVGEHGVAVRAAIAGLQGLAHLTADGTRLTLPSDGRAWVLDYQTWYETPRRGVDVADLGGDVGFPLLARLGSETGDTNLFVTESDIDGRFSGAHLVAHDGALDFVFADPSVEVARGDLTPWRVFMLGTLAEIAESRFVDELAPAGADAEWVRPGRAAWSWWSDFYSGAQLERQQHFVDVAAQLGWEHLLIDCGWEETWVPEIVAYASLRGIQVHLWCVWHDLDGPEKLARLALWRSWGVAGIKVDFMESESKDRYRWYDSVLAETARLGLMVNFHGSVIPRGWARTYPQVVGYEAIRGSEYYVFYNDTPLTAAHNVIQPFTRNVVGAMDYTPVAFTAPGRTTSDGHELALSVAFECGITHFADSVDAVLERPAAARFLAELAPSWDETLLLGGTPDTEAVIARRAGDRWFVGVIATGPARVVRAPLERLALGAADAWVVADGDGGLREYETPVGEVLEVPVAENGGFVAVLTAARGELFRAVERKVAEAPVVEPALVELVDGAAELRVAEDAALRLPVGWSAERVDGGWRVIAPKTLQPGQLGVVTVEAPGEDPRVPRVAHARLIAPIVSSIRGSALPMLAFVNESGPVERDMSNGGGNPADGQRMSIAGQEFDHGFGVSTPSRLDLHLGGRAERLTLLVGVDDETPDTRARAIVLGDGVELASVEVESGAPAIPLDVAVGGIRILSLATEPLASTPAHVDWAATDLHTTPSLGSPLTEGH